WRSRVAPLCPRAVFGRADAMKPDPIARMKEKRLFSIRIVRADRTAADQAPAARSFGWIDAGLPRGHRNGTGRNSQARRGAARRGDARIYRGHVGETRNEPD